MSVLPSYLVQLPKKVGHYGQFPVVLCWPKCQLNIGGRLASVSYTVHKNLNKIWNRPSILAQVAQKLGPRCLQLMAAQSTWTQCIRTQKAKQCKSYIYRTLGSTINTVDVILISHPAAAAIGQIQDPAPRLLLVLVL
jgi:hypothetical protein